MRGAGDEIRRAALARGFDEATATRLGQVVEVIGRSKAGPPITLEKLASNPGRALALLDADRAWSIAVSGGEGAPPREVVALAREDLSLLTGALFDRPSPRWATGADLYARFAHPGPPHPVALNPPPEPPYRGPALGEPDPLNPGLTMAVLDHVLTRCVRPVADDDSWVEILLDELPRDYRMAVSADVARAGPLRPDGRAVLQLSDWESSRRLLRAQAQVAFDYRDALLRAEEGPSEHELARAPHIGQWRVIDLGRIGPCLEGRVTNPVPGGLEEIGPSLLMALGPGSGWARLLRSWIRLGPREEATHPLGAPESRSEFVPRRLDQEETRAALRVLRRRVESLLEGLRPPRGVPGVRAGWEGGDGI